VCNLLVEGFAEPKQFVILSLSKNLYTRVSVLKQDSTLHSE